MVVKPLFALVVDGADVHDYIASVQNVRVPSAFDLCDTVLKEGHHILHILYTYIFLISILLRTLDARKKFFKHCDDFQRRVGVVCMLKKLVTRSQANVNVKGKQKHFMI